MIGGAFPNAGSASAALARVRKMLARIQYKPNWALEAREFGDGITLVVSYPAPDSRRQQPGQMRIVFMVSETAYLLEAFDDCVLLEWVRSAVQRAEMHEFDEFFYVDGKVLNDPHAHD